MFSLRTSIERPSRSAAYFWSTAGYFDTSAVIRWFLMPVSTLNQFKVTCASTRPLPGIPFGITQSNALMRSVATNKIESPRS